MTMTRAQLKKGLKASLKREGKIKVGDSYPREDLVGKTLTIASKTVTVCNGAGRCASEAHCIGLSLFATDPQVPKAKPKKDKKIGWRHGTVKICLTHLMTTKGEPLIPLDVAPLARVKRTSANPPQDTRSGFGGVVFGVSGFNALVAVVAIERGVFPVGIDSVGAPAIDGPRMVMALDGRTGDKRKFGFQALDAKRAAVIHDCIERIASGPCEGLADCALDGGK